jgi:hypothetical protein
MSRLCCVWLALVPVGVSFALADDLNPNPYTQLPPNPAVVASPTFPPPGPSYLPPAMAYTPPVPTYPTPSPPVAAESFAIRPAGPLPELEKSVESSWYTRIDYFHWHESGDYSVDESGPLYTLGYLSRVGAQRIRAEFFGGYVHYNGYAQFSDEYGNLFSEPLTTSSTRYLGCRAEYEYLMEPHWWPNATFSVGIGSRFWLRDLRDSLADYGDPVTGYHETWWTIYPFLGLENALPLGNGAELFSSIHVGATALTYQFCSLLDHALRPGLGMLAQVEFGIRGPRASLSGYFETMNWSHSRDVEGWYQPASQMYTIGGRLGLMF